MDNADPDAAKPQADRFLSWPQVQALAGISRATAWRLQKAGEFPAPIKLSPNRVGWCAQELAAWFAYRRALSRPHRQDDARGERGRP